MQRFFAPKVSPVALGVSISDSGIVATLVRAPGTVIGLYRASPQHVRFLGLNLTLQDAITQLQSAEDTPICLAPSPEVREISEKLRGAVAGRVHVVRPADLPAAELVASRNVGRVLDARTDAIALAAARYALDEVIDLTHQRRRRDTTIAIPLDS